MVQLSLFPTTIESVFLRANSTKKAFYYLELSELNGYYIVSKESGIYEKVLDSRAWKFKTLEQAISFFTRKLKTKTNQKRVSPRIYEVVTGPTSR